MVLQLAGALEQSLEVRVVLLDAGQLGVQGVELLAHAEHGAVRFHGPVQHGAVEDLGGLLRQVAHAGPAGEHARAGFRSVFPEDHPDQRGLAGPVRAHQGAAVARGDDPAELVEQDPLADRVTDVLQVDHALLHRGC